MSTELPLDPSDPNQSLPLAYAQEPIWFLDQLHPGGTAYLLQSIQRLKGELSIPAFEWALHQVVRRHDSLRTRFPSEHGKPIQLVTPFQPFAVSVEKLPSRDGVETESALRARLDQLASQPFDLSTGPLFRWVMIELSPQEHVFGFFTHHIVMDGWSMGLLWKELTTFYNAKLSGTPAVTLPVVMQPLDYARWQRQHWTGATLETELEFWREELSGSLPVLQLPTDASRSVKIPLTGRQFLFEIPSELFQRFKMLCQRERASSFMGLLALYQSLLHRFTRLDDILVGYGSSGRHLVELEPVLGMFVNTVVLRTDFSDRPTFLEILRRVRNKALDAFEHQDLPFEILVRDLAPERNPASNPIFQAAFTYMNTPEGSADLTGLRTENIVSPVIGAKFEILLGFHECGSRLTGAFEYRPELLSEGEVRGMVEVMEELMRGVVSDGGKGEVKGYEVVRGEKREEILGLSGEGDEESWSVLEEVRKRVEECRGEEAVVSEEERVSYGELKRRAEGLGRELKQAGVGEGSLVGLCVERSVEWVVGVLGIWLAGGAYVAMEPGYPEERKRYLIQDTGAKVVVSGGEVGRKLPSPGVKVVEVKKKYEEVGEVLEWKRSKGDLAYVIYTSGSTGEPKGVAIEHGQLGSYVKAVVERLDLPKRGKYATVSTVAADLGHTVIFPGLCLGGSVHVVSEERATNGKSWGEYVKREGIEVLKIVPSHLRALESGSERGEVLPIRRLVLGGEASSSPWVKRVMEEGGPELVVCNHYGPTETTVGAIASQLEEEDLESGSGNVPLGKPLKNARVYVVDEKLKLVPRGVPGEVCIGGSGVGRGYWKREELTAEKFVANPFHAGGRMYRTGDLGRWTRDGRLEFLGRIDQQVKVRGYRVELGEVESELKRQRGVKEAVVELKGGELVGYVVPEKKGAAGVRRGNTKRLPNGMRVAQVNRNETEYIYQEIFELQAYVKHGIRIRDGGVILDVGANIGLFSVFANVVAKEPRVYAFEPNPVVYEALRKNVAAYGEKSQAYEWGMGEEEKEAELTFFEGFSLLSGLHTDEEVEKEVVKNYVKNQQKESGKGKEELEREAEELVEGRFKTKKFGVKIKTVSGFLKEEGIEEVDLLKVNVEKSELEVLKGVKKEDWKKIRQVVVEVDVKGNREPIVKMLEGEGYEVVVEQDRLLEKTELCYVYAIRGSELGRIKREEGDHRVEVKVPEESCPGVEELRKGLGERLPEYMVPGKYVYLEELPLTKNGKVDRKRLPEVEEAESGEKKEKTRPRNEQEKRIAEIWEEVLGVKEVGVEEDFFELGGHSLKATQVVSRISQAFDVTVPLRILFDGPTVAGLSTAVTELREKKLRKQASREKGVS